MSTSIHRHRQPRGRGFTAKYNQSKRAKASQILYDSTVS
ncbi:expressed protein [Echinococcus multilocularis]|uniref:Expressed protein n=1 Tax=Echinococcus multilocularis TaxID=6211 RepID=A0A068Y107_ECHMU|nr:expressed protein [Echinococcus multilocularis]